MYEIIYPFYSKWVNLLDSSGNFNKMYEIWNHKKMNEKKIYEKICMNVLAVWMYECLAVWMYECLAVWIFWQYECKNVSWKCMKNEIFQENVWNNLPLLF